MKDLGPQMNWRTVFLFEYLGPLIIHPVFFYLQRPIYGQEFAHNTVQMYYLMLIF